MTSDTATAEPETVKRFPDIESMIIHHNPSWAYLVNATLPVRPPTDAEAAAYKARYEDHDWCEIYDPAEPRIVLPPSAPELTALLPAAPEPDGEPEAIEGVIVPDEPALAEVQRDSLDSLARWAPKADTGSLSAVRDEPEVHHETVTLRAVPDEAE